MLWRENGVQFVTFKFIFTLQHFWTSQLNNMTNITKNLTRRSKLLVPRLLERQRLDRQSTLRKTDTRWTLSNTLFCRKGAQTFTSVADIARGANAFLLPRCALCSRSRPAFFTRSSSFLPFSWILYGIKSSTGLIRTDHVTILDYTKHLLLVALELGSFILNMTQGERENFIILLKYSWISALYESIISTWLYSTVYRDTSHSEEGEGGGAR